MTFGSIRLAREPIHRANVMLYHKTTDRRVYQAARGGQAGADDVLSNDDGSIEVITPPNDYMAVKEALAAAGFSAEFGQVTMKAENETVLTGDAAGRMQKLIDVLESLDDVQEVYTTVVLEE